MIPAAIAWESALSEPNAAFRGDSDRSGSPKEGIGENPAREETATAIPGRYSDELLGRSQPRGRGRGREGWPPGRDRVPHGDLHDRVEGHRGGSCREMWLTCRPCAVSDYRD